MQIFFSIGHAFLPGALVICNYFIPFVVNYIVSITSTQSEGKEIHLQWIRAKQSLAGIINNLATVFGEWTLAFSIYHSKTPSCNNGDCWRNYFFVLHIFKRTVFFSFLLCLTLCNVSLSLYLRANSDWGRKKKIFKNRQTNIESYVKNANNWNRFIRTVNVCQLFVCSAIISVRFFPFFALPLLS